MVNPSLDGYGGNTPNFSGGFNQAAKGPQGKKDFMFQKADANGDGSLDVKEFNSFKDIVAQKIGDKGPGKHSLDFAKTDSDNNGQISKDELKSGRPAHAQPFPVQPGTPAYAGGVAPAHAHQGGHKVAKSSNEADQEQNRKYLMKMMASEFVQQDTEGMGFDKLLQSLD